MGSISRFSVPRPAVGRWYRRTNGQLFEVVAIDNDDASIELQFFDGTIDEVDRDTWEKLLIEQVAQPEDWSGAVDMDAEDFMSAEDGCLPGGYHNPLFLFEDRE